MSGVNRLCCEADHAHSNDPVMGEPSLRPPDEVESDAAMRARISAFSLFIFSDWLSFYRVPSKSGNYL